ncbi:hypothetical protein [Streptomyces sp. Tue6028]
MTSLRSDNHGIAPAVARRRAGGTAPPSGEVPVAAHPAGAP